MLMISKTKRNVIFVTLVVKNIVLTFILAAILGQYTEQMADVWRVIIVTCIAVTVIGATYVEYLLAESLAASHTEGG